MKPRLLLVEDDASRAALLERTLREDFDCAVCATADQALRSLAQGGWDAAVVDFDLGREGTGFLVLQAVHLVSERTVRVLYSSHWNDGLAQEARRTAHAHASLDARREEFIVDLRRTLRALVDHDEPSGPPADDAPPAGTARWCAAAPATRRFLDELRAGAMDRAPVFVHGEPGTGKHLAAETLQRWRANATPEPVASDEGALPARLIRVPPLRERREDVPELTARWLAQLAHDASQPPHALSPDALSELARRDWWGNVRELHATLYRAARRATQARIEVRDLPGDIVPPDSALQLAKDEGVRQALLLQLRTAGSVRAAATLAGVTRPNFKRLMKRHGILRADTLGQPE